MAEDNYEDRTEAATPRKRQETRQRGNVVRSVDLNSAVILLAAVVTLDIYGRPYVSGMVAVLQNSLGQLHAFEPGQGREILDLGIRTAAYGFASLIPIVIAVVVAALAINLVQVGFLMTGEPLKLNLERLNPVTGLQRIFSMRGFVRLAAGMLKLSIVAVVVGVTVWNDRFRLLDLMSAPFPDVLGTMLDVVYVVALRAALALLVLAILDYGYHRWQHEKDIRMSRHEVREEMKRYEGDPKIRERRRGIQRQLAMQRMMARVPKATVVVTNPTEYSVALEYDQNAMDAPRVAAKGAGYLALRIREIAMEHGVPIVQRPEVARALYRDTEVGQTVPYELYQAVAEILAMVYRMKGMTVGAV